MITKEHRPTSPMAGRWIQKVWDEDDKSYTDGVDWGEVADGLLAREDEILGFIEDAKDGFDPVESILERYIMSIPGKVPITDQEEYQRDLLRIILTNDPAKKIAFIKEIRALTGMNLKDAKYFVEALFHRLMVDSKPGPYSGTIPILSIPVISEWPQVKRLYELREKNDRLVQQVHTLTDIRMNMEKALEERRNEVQELYDRLDLQDRKIDDLTSEVKMAEDQTDAYRTAYNDLVDLIDMCLPRISSAQVSRIIRTEKYGIGERLGSFLGEEG